MRLTVRMPVMTTEVTEMTWDTRLDPFGKLLPGKSWDDQPGMDPGEQEYLLAVIDRPIAIHRCLAEVAGDLSAGAMLTELSALEQERGCDWLDVDEAEWTHRLGLSPAQQHATRRKLVRLGFLEEKLFGNVSRVHFRLVWPALDAALRQQSQQRVAYGDMTNH